MCGRFALLTLPEVLATFFELSDAPSVRPRFNIAPTQDALAFRVVDGQREAELLHWGLVPFWAKDPSIGSRLINARSETASGRAAFRQAFRKRRCIIPASGFYEWRREDKRKQPFYIRPVDRSPIAFAGLWEEWRDPDRPDAPLLESFTILTTEPNVLVRDIHNRMPVILRPLDFELWLDPDVSDPDDIRHLLRPVPSDNLEAYTISSYVNSPAHEGPECIRPTEPSDAPDQAGSGGETLWG